MEKRGGLYKVILVEGGRTKALKTEIDMLCKYLFGTQNVSKGTYNFIPVRLFFTNFLQVFDDARLGIQLLWNITRMIYRRFIIFLEFYSPLQGDTDPQPPLRHNYISGEKSTFQKLKSSICVNLLLVKYHGHLLEISISTHIFVC